MSAAARLRTATSPQKRRATTQSRSPRTKMAAPSLRARQGPLRAHAQRSLPLLPSAWRRGAASLQPGPFSAAEDYSTQRALRGRSGKACGLRLRSGDGEWCLAPEVVGLWRHEGRRARRRAPRLRRRLPVGSAAAPGPAASGSSERWEGPEGRARPLGPGNEERKRQEGAEPRLGWRVTSASAGRWAGRARCLRAAVGACPRGGVWGSTKRLPLGLSQGGGQGCVAWGRAVAWVGCGDWQSVWGRGSNGSQPGGAERHRGVVSRIPSVKTSVSLLRVLAGSFPPGSGFIWRTALGREPCIESTEEWIGRRRSSVSRQPKASRCNISFSERMSLQYICSIQWKKSTNAFRGQRAVCLKAVMA